MTPKEQTEISRTLRHISECHVHLGLALDELAQAVLAHEASNLSVVDEHVDEHVEQPAADDGNGVEWDKRPRGPGAIF